MGFSLKPKSDKFFTLYINPAEKIMRAAKILRKMSFSSLDENRKLAKEIGKLERGADQDRRITMTSIMSTFVTPFDRDDLHELASNLEDCMDYIDDAAELMLVINLEDYPGRIQKQLKIIEQAGELTMRGMKSLNDLGSLSFFWDDMRYLEHKGDKYRRSMMTTLFEDEKDPIMLLKLKEITEQLEMIINKFEMISDTVESIALKEK
jgi:predicted phosphate transport protein (TIGR00153 family)